MKHFINTWLKPNDFNVTTFPCFPSIRRCVCVGSPKTWDKYSKMLLNLKSISMTNQSFGCVQELNKCSQSFAVLQPLCVRPTLSLEYLLLMCHFLAVDQPCAPATIINHVWIHRTLYKCPTFSLLCKTFINLSRDSYEFSHYTCNTL